MGESDLKRRYEELKASGDNGENEANDQGTPEGQLLFVRSLIRERDEARQQAERAEKALAKVRAIWESAFEQWLDGKTPAETYPWLMAMEAALAAGQPEAPESRSGERGEGE